MNYLKASWMNLVANPRRWLLFELCPAFYTLGEFGDPELTDTRYRKLFLREAHGLVLQHIPLGFMLHYFCPHLWVVAGVALTIEIIQTVRGKFIFPVNSLIDVGFYTLGAAVHMWAMK